MTLHRRVWAGLAALPLLAVLAACNSNKAVDTPARLERFDATARLQKLWSASVSGGKERLRLGLGVAIEGDVVFAAGHDGDVVAFDLATGKRLWQARTRLPLSGGPGAGEGLVVAGAGEGDIIALDAATGEMKWSTRVNSQLLSAPSIAEGVVALRAVDGRLVLLRASDGSQIWGAEQQVPSLSLRGTATPVVAGGLAISGFDNGRVMALSVADGTTVWETAVAPPTGRNELARLVDIDSAVLATDSDVYVVSYQGRVARLTRDGGQPLWTYDLSSYAGLGVDVDGVYVSTSEGDVVKIGRNTGVELWRESALAHRRLSAPATLGHWVAVGDFDGYVHLLDATTGALAARLQVGGGALAAPPVVKDDIAVFITRSGKLTAVRASAREG